LLKNSQSKQNWRRNGGQATGNGNYEQYATLVFVGADSYRQAWVLEHAYIGLWQPRLNHPYSTKFLKYKSHQLIPTKKAQTTSRVSLGFRLLRKVRIRMHAQYKTKHVAALTSHRGFDLLWQLSSATRQSFDAQRFLRSNNFTNDDVHVCSLPLVQSFGATTSIEVHGRIAQNHAVSQHDFSIVGMSPDHFCLVTP